LSAQHPQGDESLLAVVESPILERECGRM
jgi:hypothetical protein